MQLNDQQTRAVRSRGHTVVVSVPGSGKTRILVSKCIDILQSDIRADIVLVTFTRDAAKEIRSRLAESFRSIPANVRIGTFHALSANILELNKRTFNLLKPGAQADLLHRAHRAVAHEMDWSSAQHAVQSYKSQLNPIVRAGTSHGKLYVAYQAMLQERNAMDYDDLLLVTVKGMQDGTLATLPCQYLLLDEAQDTDPVQLKWVECHLNAGAEITMVGDDDQSIYGWRSAAGYRGMLEFEQAHRAQRITLNENYRSSPEILAVADRLIRNNTARLPKTLKGVISTPGTVDYYEYDSRAEEAFAIAETVASSPSRWVVLARTNFLLDAIDAALKSRKIPYYRPGSKQFWSKPHIAKPLMTLYALTVAGKNHKEESNGVEPLLAMVGISEEEISEYRPLSFHNLMAVEQLLTPEDRTDFKELIGLVEAWQRNYHDYEVSLDPIDRANVINAVLKWYKDMFRKTTSSSRLALDIAIALGVLTNMTSPLGKAIEILRQPQGEKSNEGVALLTLHGTKGLEFPFVWMLGMESRNMPHAEAPDIEEERRLCYVGITRARERLVMSSICQDYSPSQFLAETGLLHGLAKSA